jgi:hypothetical protein
VPLALAPGSAQDYCVQWTVTGSAVALGAADLYRVKCEVQDLTSAPADSTALLVVLSLTTKTASQACARVFNRDASDAHAGELCCRGVRWGNTP